MSQSAWAALRSGSVDATSLSPEIGQQVLGEGYRVLVDLGKENVQFQSSGLVVSRSLIKSNPQLVETIAKATVEGVAFIHKPANKEIVLKSLGRNLRLSKPDQMEKAYQGLVGCAAEKTLPVDRRHERGDQADGATWDQHESCAVESRGAVGSQLLQTI